MLCLLCRRSRSLDPGRAGSKHGNALAGQRYRLSGPIARQIDFAFEIADPGDVRPDRLGQGTGPADHESCLENITPIGLDHPEPARFIPSDLVYRGVEFDVLAQIVAVGETQGIFEYFWLRRIALTPVPLLIDLRIPGHRIVHRRHIAARTWVSVPMPGPANVVAPLDNQGRHPQLSQFPQHVHTSEAGTDDNRLKSLCHQTSSRNIPKRHRRVRRRPPTTFRVQPIKATCLRLAFPFGIGVDSEWTKSSASARQRPPPTTAGQVLPSCWPRAGSWTISSSIFSPKPSWACLAGRWPTGPGLAMRRTLSIASSFPIWRPCWNDKHGSSAMRAVSIPKPAPKPSAAVLTSWA